MNVNLKRQGYYREMSYAEETDPSIMDFIGTKIDEKTKSKICGYLNEGIVLVECYGLVPDVIHPERGYAGCPSMLTDGVWVWPGDLVYYVSEYSLGLNSEFVKYMCENNWTVNQSEEGINYENLMIEGKKLID